MSRASNLYRGLAFLLLFFIASCSTTKLTSTQVDSTNKGGYINSVMIAGVSNDLERRKMFEAEFVRQFKSHGVKAVSSNAVIGPDKEINKDSIKGEAVKLGIETIFVTHLISVEEKTVSRPTRTQHYLGRPFGTYYHNSKERANSPEIELKRKNVKLESRLFEVSTEKMIWSTTSETFESKSAKDVIDSLSQAVIKNLRDNKFVR